MGKVATPHRPVGVLAIADKRLSRRGGETSLPSRRRQLLAKHMDVFTSGGHAPHQHLRLPGTPLRDGLFARGLLFVGNAKTLDFTGDVPHPPEIN